MAGKRMSCHCLQFLFFFIFKLDITKMNKTNSDMLLLERSLGDCFDFDLFHIAYI